MAVVHQLQLISDIADLNINDDEIEELQDDIDLAYSPKTDPLDISKELRVRAEEELKETPEKLKENINKLRQLVLLEKRLNARTDDIFLAAFLRARKHDVEKAFQCLKNYYKFKAAYPHFYTYCLPSENSTVYDLQHFSSLPGVDRKGRRMCAIIPGRMDLDKSPLDETFQLGTTVFEIMLEDPQLQITGTITILDLQKLTLIQQARLVTPTCAWHLANVVQDKIPLRVKAVHVVNQPFYFNAIYAVFKPFLKKKLRKRIFLHGNDYESLHKHIDPEYLPEDWGGKRKCFTNKVTRSIIKMNEHKFQEWKQYCYKGDT
ncbi:alpha-tocopherol transfer protein-like [Lycorma delicatula]|uniref:alpha-tocopherol transfer protein-like n=1 Tax=Lycorma delicatula TaxID=130591 RepID=UPI003F518EB0